MTDPGSSMCQLQSQGVTHRAIMSSPIKATLSLTYRDDPLSAAMIEFLDTVLRAASRPKKPTEPAAC